MLYFTFRLAEKKSHNVMMVMALSGFLLFRRFLFESFFLAYVTSCCSGSTLCYPRYYDGEPVENFCMGGLCSH